MTHLAPGGLQKANFSSLLWVNGVLFPYPQPRSPLQKVNSRLHVSPVTWEQVRWLQMISHTESFLMGSRSQWPLKPYHPALGTGPPLTVACGGQN